MTHAYTIWITVFMMLSYVYHFLETEEPSETAGKWGKLYHYDSNQWISNLKIHNTSDIFIFLIQKYKQYWV